VEKEGFERIVNPGVVLHVADNVSLDFALRVGAMAQTVTVQGGAPLVDTTSPTLGGLVLSDELENLPLNGRNYIGLTLMQPGVAPVNIVPGGANNGTWFVTNGATQRSNNFLLDGAIMQDPNSGSTANFAGRTLGLDGIQEYRVITNNFSGEYGLTMGSQTVMVSKGGTNQFHGSVFEYLRNSVLDARNHFDKSVAANNFQRLPPYQRNNFGASVGGPIRKDKTFFLATYEQLEERLGITTVNTVPGAECHGAAGALITSTACPQLGSTPLVKISQATAPLLAIYPLPNLPNNQFTTPYKQPDTDIFGQIRVDNIFSSSDKIFGRYTIDDDDEVLALTFPQLFTNPRLSRHQYATLSEDHIFSASLLNNVRFSFSRTISNRTATNPFIGPQYSFVTGQPMGTINVGGLTGMMGPTANPGSIQSMNILTLSDGLVYTVGRHSLKFGFDVNSFRQFALATQKLAGSLTFNSLANFLLGNASNFTAIVPTAANVSRTWQFYTLGFYVQDDWRLRSNFTLNLGLRYEPAHNYYHEVDGVSVALIHPSTDSANTIGPMFQNPTLHNFSPRLGFAWDVFGNGKTALRGGASLMYDLANLYNGLNNIIQAQPPFTALEVSSGLITIPLTFPTTAVSAADSTVDYHLRQARLYTESLTLEQQLPFSSVLSLSYVGSRGEHLLSVGELDPNAPMGFTATGLPFWNPNPAQAVHRINTAWSTIAGFLSNGSSVYNSLQAVVTKRLTHGLQFQSSFTWQKLIDNNTGTNAQDCYATTSFPADPFQSLGGINGRYDRGPACYNIPRLWVSNFIYELPSPQRREGFVGTMLSGWGLTGIYTLRDGFPFHPEVSGNRSRSGVVNAGFAGIDHPNYNPSFTGPIITGNPNQWFNPASFILQPVGTLGDVRRNSLLGPNFNQFDFAIKKETRLGFLGEAGNLTFRAEFFNIFNHTNYAMPSPLVFAGNLTDPLTAAPLANAGQITTTAPNTSRQIEFSLRVAF
jgi:outer membrane receptor protein involved in Fe transport